MASLRRIIIRDFEKSRGYFWNATYTTIAFVELPASIPVEATVYTTLKVVAILKGTNHLAVEITDQSSPSFLNTPLGTMNHAQ